MSEKGTTKIIGAGILTAIASSLCCISPLLPNYQEYLKSILLMLMGMLLLNLTKPKHQPKKSNRQLIQQVVL